VLWPFLFACFGDLRYLHSFPTRRSSDLVVVGEHHTFAGNAVDVGRAVSHQSERVGADVRLADIVAEDDQDVRAPAGGGRLRLCLDRKSTRLNSSHVAISYAVFCLKKKKL